MYSCFSAGILCKIGIKESDTGLAAPSQWDLVSDKQMMQEEQPLQVLIFTKKVLRKLWICVSFFESLSIDYIFHPGGKMHKDN